MERKNEQDSIYELLCKVVFGEASEAETKTVEAALADSAELREQKAELLATVSLVKGAFQDDGAEETLSAASLGALTAAAQDATSGAKLAGAAANADVAIHRITPWYQRGAFRAAAAAAVLAGSGVLVLSKLADERAAEPDAHLGSVDTELVEFSSVQGVEASRDDRAALNYEALGGLGYVDTYEETTKVIRNSITEQEAQVWKLELDVQEEFEVQSAPDAKAVYQLGVDRVSRVRSGAASREGGFIGAIDELGGPPTEPVALDVDGVLVQYVQPRTRPKSTGPLAGMVVTGGGGGGGGPTTAGPLGPTSPGPSGPGGPGSGGPTTGGPATGAPAGPSSPGPSKPGSSVRWERLAGARASSRPPAPASKSVKTVRDAKKAADPATITAEIEDQLRGLGYASGAGTSVPSTASGSDDFFLGRGVQMERVGVRQRLREMERIAPTPLPNERPKDMFFRFWGDNPFVVSKQDKLSTFAADVDTASFALARRTLESGHLPVRGQIRTEEFINFAKPDLASPSEGTFAIHGELAPSPFGGREDRWLLRVGVRAQEIEREERPPLSLTFVVDTSGSMKENNRLELVKHSLRLLVDQLDGRDTLSIVSFSNEAHRVLGPTPATASDTIETALFQLQPGGSTNAEAGLKLGYSTAESAMAIGTQSRVVFLSDGVANVGQTDQDRIAEDVSRQTDRGIFLNTIGVGMGNHNDVFLEQLADKGEGVCDYVGDAKDARRAIVERFVGGFVTVAKDVKIQVEFAPNQVLRWRQLGYENRAVADRDFRNDKVDAGEIGAGHQVTCLYEIELASGDIAPSDVLSTVRLRWKPVAPGEAQPSQEATEMQQPLTYASIATPSFRAASEGFRRSTLSAQLAECLRQSVHTQGEQVGDLARQLADLLSDAPSEDTAMVADMTRRAIQLGLKSLPAPRPEDVDAAHRDAYYRALIRDLGGATPVSSNGDAVSASTDTYESRIRDMLNGDQGEKPH